MMKSACAILILALATVMVSPTQASEKFLGFKSYLSFLNPNPPSKSFEHIPETYFLKEKGITYPSGYKIDELSYTSLDIEYEVECKNLNKVIDFPGLIGNVEIFNWKNHKVRHKIRFQLPLGTNSIRIPLGYYSKWYRLALTLDGHEKCSLKRTRSADSYQGHFPSAFQFETSLHFDYVRSAKLEKLSREEWQIIARRFAPYLMIRGSQLGHSLHDGERRFNDLPLGYVFYYKEHPEIHGQFYIYYSAIFSNSDADEWMDIEERLEERGRRFILVPLSRITIEVDSHSQVVEVPHSRWTFSPSGLDHKLDRWKGGGVLVRDHGVMFLDPHSITFSTYPQDGFQEKMKNHREPWEGYIFDPIVLMPNEFVDCVPLENPWMCKISDLECCRQFRTRDFVTKYLFARIDPSAGVTQLALEIDRRDFGVEINSFEPLVAIRVGKDRLDGITENRSSITVKLYDKNLDRLYPAKLPVEFFRYIEHADGRYEVVPVDSRSFNLR